MENILNDLDVLIGIIVTLCTATATATYYVTRAMITKNQQSFYRLSDDHVFEIMRMHQCSVASEFGNIIRTYLIAVLEGNETISDESLDELKKKVMAMIENKRQYLRIFNSSIGRLDKYAEKNFDYQRIEECASQSIKILSSDKSNSIKAKEFDDMINIILSELLKRLRNDLNLSNSSS